MKKIILIAVLIAAAGGFYFNYRQGNEFEGFEKNLLGQWSGEKDAANRFFNENHTLYVAGLGTIFQEIKWKIKDATPGSNRMVVYFYDAKDTEQGKRFAEKWKNYKDPGFVPQKYPATFTYAPGEGDILTVYDEKGEIVEILHKVSDRQEPVTAGR